MKACLKYNVRSNKISLALIMLICTIIVIWACKEVQILSTYPLEELDVISTVNSSRIPTSSNNVLSANLCAVEKLDSTRYKETNHGHYLLPICSSTRNSHRDDSVSNFIILAKSSRSPMTRTDGSDQKQSVEYLFNVERVENNSSKEAFLSFSSTGFSRRSSSRVEGVDHDKNTSLEMNGTQRQTCNYGKGKWIKANQVPLYSGFRCKQWLSAMWACRLMKRTDFSYEKFRWKPQDCDLPEFSSHRFLHRMHNKTIALIGDSLGRQQFQSLMCMITAGKADRRVKDVGKEYGFGKVHGDIRPNGWAYRFQKTNTTILFHWSASLCEVEPLNKSDPATSYAMHLDRPTTFLRKYLDKFDVLVLNTGHHWNRWKFTTNRWEMYVGGRPNTNRKLAEMGNAKNLTIHSIVKWLDTQLQWHPQLKAFLRTISPRHFVNGEWNTGGSCDNTVPLVGGSEVLQDGSSDLVAEAAVRGTKVRLLDITALSRLRDEGHISRYSFKSSQVRHDCLHWCLPGIPDTWNEILYAQLSADTSDVNA
ncbi:protein trichome birefringence-like 14 isoform X1 [Canna indica]|uniref:Protein trichome birefringence-like 14 isoform X1 n=1 Tax=Canna indica TaxID=4628 RepID=A0AAQ3QMX1_9LILI|nr:protein trichome birefringence-like 14 isoform X1 [Canna indica]